MHTGRGAIGVVGIDSDKPGPLLTPDQRRLLDALMDQAALAIERVHLVEDMDRAKRTAETDRLRSALLTSISHDLKTPLAAVLGAAGTLRDLVGKLIGRARRPICWRRSSTKSERLNRFIANLLDMTKLESGAVVPNAALHDLGEIVGSALRRASKILAQHRVEVELATDLPMVAIDPVLFEQVLFNLLDNAAKYAPAGTTVRIQSWRDRGFGRPADLGRRRRHSARRPGAHLRQVLSGAEGRSRAGRHRTWSRDFARLRRGHERHDRRGKPDGSDGGDVHDHAAGPGGDATVGHRRMTAAPLKVLVIDDEPPIRKLLRMGLTHARLSNSRGAERQDRA